MAEFVSPERFHVSKQLNSSIAEKIIAMPRHSIVQFYDLVPDSKTLDVLNNVVFKTRKDITLRVYDYQDRWSKVKFLKHLPELERFDWQSDVFKSMEPLGHLKKLTHLGIGFSQPTPKISLDFLVDYRNTLKSLAINGDYYDLLTIVPELKHLSTIRFAATKLRDLSFLDSLPIERFENEGSRIHSIDGLKNIKTLRFIGLKANNNIHQLNFIKDLPLIENIDLQYLSRLTAFPKCDNLKHLKRVYAFECHNLVDIKELKKLKSCRVAVGGKKLKERIYQKNTQEY